MFKKLSLLLKKYLKISLLRNILKLVGVGLGILALSLLTKLLFYLPANLNHPIDAILVLGGSIYREIYAADLALTQPEIPVLISTGSDPPCIWLIFEAKHAPKDHVLLERCADSTFDNFFYSIPILQDWGVHKVKLITSSSHLPRALWLAQILFSSQGIPIELAIAPTYGTPGNQEMWLKTGLDISRSLVWALFSQVIKSSCPQVIPLATLDWQQWLNQGFVCESQQVLDLNYD